MDSRKSSPSKVRLRQKTHNRHGVYAYCSVERCEHFACSGCLCSKHYTFVLTRKNAATRERSLARQRKYRAKNLDELRERQKLEKRRWREANRVEDRRRVREWQLKHPEKCRALKARYKYNKKKNTPKWANRTALDEMFNSCPTAFHVDHIIPLNHPSVSGLHVPWNLQYLSPKDNVKKSNQFDFTYENESWKASLVGRAA